MAWSFVTRFLTSTVYREKTLTILLKTTQLTAEHISSDLRVTPQWKTSQEMDPHISNRLKAQFRELQNNELHTIRTRLLFNTSLMTILKAERLDCLLWLCSIIAICNVQGITVAQKLFPDIHFSWQICSHFNSTHSYPFIS